MKFTNESTSIEYCPFCRTAANMIATVTLKAIARKDDTTKTITITTKTYHCGSCGSFVRSINEEGYAESETAPDPDVIAQESVEDPEAALEQFREIVEI